MNHLKNSLLPVISGSSGQHGCNRTPVRSSSWHARAPDGENKGMGLGARSKPQVQTSLAA